MAAAVSVAFAATLALAPAALANQNPFQADQLSSGYNLATKPKKKASAVRANAVATKPKKRASAAKVSVVATKLIAKVSAAKANVAATKLKLKANVVRVSAGEPPRLRPL